MSKLVQMRSRIHTIETIKKVTDAMRIISMSTHSRLKVKQEPLREYIASLTTLLEKVISVTPEWKNETLMPTPSTEPDNSLLIVIGSQRGLCGGFNTALFKYLGNYLEKNKSQSFTFIGVGKKAADYLQEQYPARIVTIFPTFTTNTYTTIAQAITDLMINEQKKYSSVTIISNHFKSFFSQKPSTKKLIPFNPEKIKAHHHAIPEEYLWDQPKAEIITTLAMSYITAQLHHTLFQSLLSEHAARFVSMDSSTRNANSLLETTKLEYNKLRQTKITTEITELSSSF